MKKVYAFIFIVIVVSIYSACTKMTTNSINQEITNAIKSQLNNPESYKSVAWGTLDSAFTQKLGVITNKSNEEVYQDPDDHLWYAVKKRIIMKSNNYNLLKSVSGKLFIMSYNDTTKYNPKERIFFGYTISHTFRIKMDRNMKLVKYMFILDANKKYLDCVDMNIEAIDSGNL